MTRGGTVIQQRLEFLDERSGLCRTRLWQKYRELVATEPRWHVYAPEISLQHSANLFEYTVAGFVTKRIVDALEIIDVDVYDTESALVAPGALQLTVQSFSKGTRVEQSRQAVAARKALCFAHRKPEPVQPFDREYEKPQAYECVP
jgi:hypothetical protein